MMGNWFDSGMGLYGDSYCMRKQYKKKLRSWPNKTGGSIRWKPKEEQEIKLAEKEIKNLD